MSRCIIKHLAPVAARLPVNIAADQNEYKFVLWPRTYKEAEASGRRALCALLSLLLLFDAPFAGANNITQVSMVAWSLASIASKTFDCHRSRI